MSAHRGALKSRNGCHTCRRRKIKCDEDKPLCQNCVRSGKACSGYHQVFTWSRKHEMEVKQQLRARSGLNPRSSDSLHGLDGFVEGHDSSFRLLGVPPLYEESGTGHTGRSDSTPFCASDIFEAVSPLFSQDPSNVSPWQIDQHVGPSISPLVSQSLDTEVQADSTDLITCLSTLKGEIKDTTEGPSEGQVLGTGKPPITPCHSSHLLRFFYRLTAPREPPQQLAESDIVHYFFKNVNSLYCCFSSDRNRFQHLVAKYWRSSQTICFTIQSMALAHMANWYPRMAAVGIHKRTQAWRSLQSDLGLMDQAKHEVDEVLLSLFLLGASSQWLQTADQTICYLETARVIVQRRLILDQDGANQENLSDFWAASLVHWEMVTSYTDPVPIVTFDGYQLPPLELSSLRCPRLPHPWTGVATDLHFALAEVGRVARRRKAVEDQATDETRPFMLDQAWLHQLENFICRIPALMEGLIEDCGDAKTTKSHMISMAEACRAVSLMEIYRLNPELLRLRHHAQQQDSAGDFSPFVHCAPAESDGPLNLDTALAALAIHALDLMLSVPLTSGMSHSQTSFITICAAHLRLPQSDGRSGLAEATPTADDILRHRYLIENRLVALSRKLPRHFLLEAMDMVRSIWNDLDGSRELVF